MSSACLMMRCILMFIGGSPAGTAGGVKTTTIAMLLLTCLSVIRGKRDTECFGRKIPQDNVRSGVTIIMVTFSFLMAGVTILSILEPTIDMMRILYEAVSAIATVGLTADLTPTLCMGSKVVLMVLMYVGRIGPVTMALIFSGKVRLGTHFRDLPQKRILIG